MIQTGPASNLIPVIILNWNGEQDTIECLRSVTASRTSGFLPIVVDNGSSADNLERLKRECGFLFSTVLCLHKSDLGSFDQGRAVEIFSDPAQEMVVLIENGANLGFAKGNNVGVKFAELIGSDWVMLLNNDTVVSAGAFHQLRDFVAAHPSFVAVTPQIRYYEPNTRIQNCGGDLTYFGSRKYRFAGRAASSLPKIQFSQISFITGCALLFNHRVTGRLTESFFFGEEDYEFSLRLRNRGLAMACVHSAVIHHKVGTSIKRSSRPLGAIVVHYASRLLNTRNYYSSARWQATRILAYLYLPVLLIRNGIQVKHSVAAIREIESALKRNRGIDFDTFRAMICLQ